MTTQEQTGKTQSSYEENSSVLSASATQLLARCAEQEVCKYKQVKESRIRKRMQTAGSTGGSSPDHSVFQQSFCMCFRRRTSAKHAAKLRNAVLL